MLTFPPGSRLIQRGVPRLSVRRIMHAISALGCALCVAPLAVGSGQTSPIMATLWLTAFNVCYAASFSGLHAYIQVRPLVLQMRTIQAALVHSSRSAPADLAWRACVHQQDVAPADAGVITGLTNSCRQVIYASLCRCWGWQI